MESMICIKRHSSVLPVEKSICLNQTNAFYANLDNPKSSDLCNIFVTHLLHVYDMIVICLLNVCNVIIMVTRGVS